MQLEIKGIIMSGDGLQASQPLPGKDSLPHAPSDWPKALCSGSLNIELTEDRLSPEFRRLGPGYCLLKLDNYMIKPAFILSGKLLPISKPNAEGKVIRRLDALLWRAKVRVEKNGVVFPCWVFRRHGLLRTLMEVVSDVNLRETYDLKDGDRLVLVMQGETWDVTPEPFDI